MIEIQRLGKTYPPDVRALRSVSLTIGPGLFGLLGPNGAGKSTLMRLLVGLETPTVGSVVVAGVNVGAHPEAIQHRLGYLPQDFGFYPHLSGVQMLTHLVALKGRAAGGRARRLAQEALARVGLGGVARRPVRDYSGGMRQRLGIAQALIGEPEVLVLDEPSTGLDPEERDRFHAVLSGLADRCTIVLSTHQVEDVAHLCSRFALLAQGRIVEVTTPDAACAQLAGRVFEGDGERVDAAALDPVHLVTQSFFVQGRNRMRIVAGEAAVPAGFTAVPASLADAYRYLLRQAAAEAPGRSTAAT